MRSRSSSGWLCRGTSRNRPACATRRFSSRLPTGIDAACGERESAEPYDVEGGAMRITRWIALAAAAMTLAASPLAVAQDKVSLRLNWYLGGLHVPFYYGKDKGYYAAEGIDLTIN